MRTFRTLFFTALACLGVMMIVNPPIDHSAGYVGYKIGNAVGAGLFLLAWGALFAALGAGIAKLRSRPTDGASTWGAAAIVIFALVYVSGTLMRP